VKYTVAAIRTEIFHLNQNLAEFIIANLSGLKDGSVLAVTSKLISLAEGRVVARDQIDKTTLVKREADQYFGETQPGCHLTIKHGIFIPSSGIDESNAEEPWYLLFPENPFASAKKLHVHLTRHYGIDRLAILLTDSHVVPLRKGVSGITLAYWGINGHRELKGTPDLFGRVLRMTSVNVVDGLSAAAVLAMGEGAESSPLALIEGVELDFTEEVDPFEMRIPPREDLFCQLVPQSDGG
jgi:F420-0:gamma-glutamyl ligase